jgi:hypothetical protein
MNQNELKSVYRFAAQTCLIFLKCTHITRSADDYQDGGMGDAVDRR